MSPSALPLIAESEYPAFQRLVPELMQTSFEDWLDDHKKAIAYRKARNGFVEVPLSAEGFSTWLPAQETSPHLELLWVYAEEIASDRSGS
jgi:hypothetical protein